MRRCHVGLVLNSGTVIFLSCPDKLAGKMCGQKDKHQTRLEARGTMPCRITPQQRFSSSRSGCGCCYRTVDQNEIHAHAPRAARKYHMAATTNHTSQAVAQFRYTGRKNSPWSQRRSGYLKLSAVFQILTDGLSSDFGMHMLELTGTENRVQNLATRGSGCVVKRKGVIGMV